MASPKTRVPLKMTEQECHRAARNTIEQNLPLVSNDPSFFVPPPIAEIILFYSDSELHQIRVERSFA
jgi:hypothetical protein